MVLREVQQTLVIEQIVNCVEGLKFLILDDFTTNMMSAVMKMKDLIGNGSVMDTRHISMSLQEPTNMPVIYFIMPSEDNVSKLIAHFDTDVGEPLYGDMYVFFTSYCSEINMKMLRSSKKVMSKLKALKEVNCGFIRCNDYAFHISSSQCFSMYYNPKMRHLRDSTYLTKLATQVISVCIQLGHFPGKIRYLNNFSSAMNREFAEEVRRLIQLYHLENRETMVWSNIDSTIIIMDRSFDTITPVLHDLTTEALARDYLAIGLEGNNPNTLKQNEYIYSVQTAAEEEMKTERVLYLDDSNHFWRNMRYTNIVEAIGQVQQLIDDLKNQEKLEQGNVKQLSLTKLQELMSKYPEQRFFKEMIGALSHLVEQTLQVYSKKVVECEQYLASNLEQKKGELINWKIVQEVLKSNADGTLGRQLSLNERIRLLYLYARSLSSIGGISMDELNIRFEEADIPDDYIPVLSNMDFLGTPIIAQSGSWAKFKEQNRDWKQELSCEFIRKIPIRPDKMPSIVDWCPNIYHLVKELVQNPSYNFDKFPALDVHPKPMMAKKRKTNIHNQHPHQQRLAERNSVVVFVSGGLTYGEAKYAQLLNDFFHKNGGPFVFLGGSQLINPDDFLEKVNGINSLIKYDTNYGPSPPIRAAESIPKRSGLLRKTKSYATMKPYGNNPVRASDSKKMKNQKKKDAKKRRTSTSSLYSLDNRIAGMNKSAFFMKGLADEVYGSYKSSDPTQSELKEETK